MRRSQALRRLSRGRKQARRRQRRHREILHRRIGDIERIEFADLSAEYDQTVCCYDLENQPTELKEANNGDVAISK